MSKKAIGEKRIKEILGANSDSIIKTLEEMSPDFANYVVEFAYGDLYARSGLSDKDRELAVIACLIGQGNTGMPFRSHIRGMLNVGWTKKEIIELMIFAIGFVGFPSIVDAMKVVKEVFSE